jgi:tight adherence protein C
MPSSSLILAATIFVLLIVGALSLYHAFSGDRGAHAGRLGAPSGWISTRSLLMRDEFEWHGVAQKLLDSRVKRLRTLLSKNRTLQRLHSTLAHAGYSGLQAIVVFRTLLWLSTGVGGMLGFLAATLRQWPSLPIALLGALIGYMLPQMVLKRLQRSRQTKIFHELPAILDLLVVSLEAGLSMIESIKLVGRETERQGHLLGAEFTAAAAEMSAGVSMEDSLMNLADRTGIEDVKSVAALLIQSEKIGGRLGPALRASAELMSTKRRLVAEEAAQKSAIKMLVPLVLLILPAMMIVILGPAVIQIVKVLTS